MSIPETTGTPIYSTPLIDPGAQFTGKMVMPKKAVDIEQLNAVMSLSHSAGQLIESCAHLRDGQPIEAAATLIIQMLTKASSLLEDV